MIIEGKDIETYRLIVLKSALQMYAKIKTSVKYRNIGGQWVEITQFLGSLVACKVWADDLQKHVAADFPLSSIEEIRNEPKNQYKNN